MLFYSGDARFFFAGITIATILTVAIITRALDRWRSANHWIERIWSGIGFALVINSMCFIVTIMYAIQRYKILVWSESIAAAAIGVCSFFAVRDRFYWTKKKLAGYFSVK